MTEINKLYELCKTSGVMYRAIDAHLKNSLNIYGVVDKDGYPTAALIQYLEKISLLNTKIEDILEIVKSAWHHASMTWIEEGDIVHVSCFGWSGNESIIRAMRKNEFLWLEIFEQEQRGGHFQFRAKSEPDEDEED